MPLPGKIGKIELSARTRGAANATRPLPACVDWLSLNRRWKRTRIFESLPLEVTKNADVSPSAVTFRGRKLLISFVDGQNRTQEADGSIPFISTKLQMIFFAAGHRENV